MIYWMEESIGAVIIAIADTPEAVRIQTAENLFKSVADWRSQQGPPEWLPAALFTNQNT
jgi:hypothetical protein